jgi:hypothetical protein
LYSLLATGLAVAREIQMLKVNIHKHKLNKKGIDRDACTFFYKTNLVHFLFCETMAVEETCTFAITMVSVDKIL